MVKGYVLDASTAILLAKVTLLRSFATEKTLVIATAAWEEIKKKPNTDDALLIQELIHAKHINVKNAEGGLMQQKFNLGLGEAEALAIAVKESFILATDDGRAIKACKILDIPFITAIHALLFVFRRGTMGLDLALEKLRNLEKYGRYHPTIISNAYNNIRGENHD